MGIPGLYNHIGNGERIAISKFAVEHYMRYGRKLRIAIDASIWLFEVKSGRGGRSPEIRTFYYRLLKLLALGVEPIFVFDGPGRPTQKRNKKFDGFWESCQAQDARTLLDAFGFVHHKAPGEAEAECARLQTAKIVDAVMSEDVDTLMFGATVHLRNWSCESGGKVRTHIDVFRSDKIKAETGLDRKGMVLIALMHGGDYDTVGIKGCGLKTACEAANGNFGDELCDLNSDDATGLGEWRQRLQYELETNESGFFKRKHKAIQIGEDFPSQEVLHAYMHPLVSNETELDDLRKRLKEHREPEITTLRNFTAEEFGWDTLPGAIRLIRGLAPPMLTYRLCEKHVNTEPEGLLAVCGARTHDSSDGIAETRVEILPLTLVPLNLTNEPLHRPDSEGGPLDEIVLDDSDSEGDVQDPAILNSQSRRERSTSPVKKRAPSKYDPNMPARFYLPEFYVRLGASKRIEQYEDSLKQPKQPSPLKARAKNTLAKTGIREGALDGYFVKTKTSTNQVVLPPPKKQRPADLTRSKTDTVRPVLRDQPLTNVYATTKQKVYNPTRAEKEYYEHVEEEMRTRKMTAAMKEAQPPTSTARRPGIEEHSCAHTVALVLQEADNFSSPVSSQELQAMLQPGAHKPGQAFSSPVSSQDLLSSERSPAKIKQDSPVKQATAKVRIRESLEGSWATASPTNQRRGSRLSDIETIDMT